MRASAGDKLVTRSGSIALIVSVLGADGHPPYVVKWLRGGNIAMVDPDPYARVIPAGSPETLGQPASDHNRQPVDRDQSPDPPGHTPLPGAPAVSDS